MSVSAADLYHLGRGLVDASAEVEKRCGIGRLYYACFQLCDQLRIDLERPLPTEGGSHEAVASALRTNKATTPENERVSLNRISVQLDNLRTARHKADYRISCDLVEKDVASAIRFADQIFSEVATFSAQHSLRECHAASQL